MTIEEAKEKNPYCTNDGIYVPSHRYQQVLEKYRADVQALCNYDGTYESVVDMYSERCKITLGLMYDLSLIPYSVYDDEITVLQEKVTEATQTCRHRYELAFREKFKKEHGYDFPIGLL